MTVEPRVEFLGFEFDNITVSGLVATLADRSDATPFSYLVTPNVDHVVRMADQGTDTTNIRGIYRDATWCTCDSRILAYLAKLSGVDLVVAPGSDLTAELLQHSVKPGDRIAIVGGSRTTASLLRSRLAGVEIIQHEPPMGLREKPQAIAAAAKFIADTRARFTFIAVGSPQQELIALAASRITDASGTALCVGAAIEFVVGQQSRAPRVLQRIGLEWAYRLIQNPKRLWRRYLVTGPRIFWIALLNAREQRKSNS